MSKEMLPEFFECVYDKDNGGICYIQMQYEKKGSITDGLNNSIVKELKVPVPSVEEQKKIIEYLNNKCSKIDLILTDREH